MTTTVAAAVTALRDLLDETTAAQWSDVQLRRWLNEAIRDMARRTHMYDDIKTIVAVSGTGEYTVPSDVLKINFMYFQQTGSTQQFPMEARAWEAMNNIWWDQQDSATGNPQLFTTFGMPPTLQLKVFPAPSIGGTFTLHVARLPVALDVATGTGNIEVPTAWLEAAYDYAEYKALRKDRDPRWQESLQLYEQKIEQMIDLRDTINAPGEFVFSGSGMLPTWLTDF